MKKRVMLTEKSRENSCDSHENLWKANPISRVSPFNRKIVCWHMIFYGISREKSLECWPVIFLSNFLNVVKEITDESLSTWGQPQ